MEPGGESTQYESIKTVTNSPPKQKGQLGVNEKNTVSELKILSDPNEQREEEELDPNLQGPQAAGSTNSISGEVDKDLKPDAKEIDEETQRTRTAQRLGAGSGIGA